MKINSVKFKIAMLFGAAAILAIFVTRPVFSQDTAKKESPKKIAIKIVSDDNGKTTVIDTIMDIPDSIMIDSIKKEIDKVLFLRQDGKHLRLKMHKMPQGFDYDFEIPSPPPCPMDPDELEEFEFEGRAPCFDMEDFTWERRVPGPDRRAIRSGGHRQTLTDILGEIPMDRVVSYSIKDRKNGKRIIIDLNDAPMFEKQDRVIVIREPGRMQRSRNFPGRQVKVYVNSDDDAQMEKTPEPPAPPPVPPPSAQPDNKTLKKPKI
jgi:hypothetical protein